MHKLLARYLQRCGLGKQKPVESLEAWNAFLRMINTSFKEWDQDRYTYERSLSIASEEMRQAFENVKHESSIKLSIEQQRLTAIFYSMKDGVCILDMDGNLQTMNAAAKALIGWTSNELIGQNLLHVLCPPNSGPKIPNIESVSANDLALIHKNGTSFAASYTLSPIFRMNTLTGYVFVFRDTTEQKKERESLIEQQLDLERIVSERTAELLGANQTLNQYIVQLKQAQDEVQATFSRVAALVAHLPGGNVLKDEEDRVLLLNQELCDLFQLIESPEALIGQTFASIIEKSDLNTKDRVLFLETSAETKDLLLNDGRVIERSEIPIFLLKEFKGCLLQYRDVTEARKINQQLERSSRLASIGRLAAGVAHEINNPLSYVLSNVELINERLTGVEVDKGELTAILSDIKMGAFRVKDVVKELKTLSRDSGESKEPVDIEETLKASLKIAANEFRHKATLRLHIDKIPKIYANASKLSQVFINLLVNAGHAIQDGEIEKNFIEVRAFQDPSQKIFIEVKDSGVGIAPEHLNKIFDPFFTTKASTGTGTGLGLSICQSIVEGLGGLIIIRSRKGEGASFTIELPAGIIADESQNKEPKAQGRVVSSQKIQMRLLIIDDEKILATTLAKLLQNDFETTVVHSIADALEFLKDSKNHPNVILSDLMMPGKGGADLYHELQKSGGHLHERMIFMTGGAFTPKSQEFLRQTSVPIIEKPFDTASLKKIIHEHTHKRRAA